jgi:hypothetical protein
MSTNIPWKDQYKHPLWQKKRLEALEQFDFSCSECGNKDATLHVHHKRYVRGRNVWEYSLAELEVLCETCHATTHTVRKAIDDLLLNCSTEGLKQVLELLSGFVASARTLCADRNLISLEFPNEYEASSEFQGGRLAGSSQRLNHQELIELVDFLCGAEDGAKTTISIPNRDGEAF